MKSTKRPLSRRDFLRISALALGGAALACGPGEQLVELTATIVPRTGLTPPPTLVAGEFADTILFNGNLITMDAAIASAKAIAIKNGRILQVGMNDAIRSLAGSATQVIDLGGKTVTPGLIDAHNHMQVWGTLLNMFIPLVPPQVTDLDELLAKLSEAVSKAKPGDWVQGYFWNIAPLPARKYLDPISPDNPVWLMQQGGHFGTANSLALQIANITAKTESPEGGVIEKDDNGEPTGVFYNHKAMDMLRVHAPQPNAEMIQGNIRVAEERMVAEGITTFHDCNARLEAVEGYMKAGRDNAMMLRGEVFYTLEWPADLERALHQIPYYTDDFMRFAGYKFLIDGSFPTWYTFEPHPGISWKMPTWNKGDFKRAVKELHNTGLQIAVHCGGDASVDLVLEAYEEAMNANPRPDPRHRIEHASLTKPDATQRAADLGVQISCQPQFLRFSPHLEELLGKERAGRIKVTREWLDAGINVALGSDVPTSPFYKPQVTLAEAVLRLGPDDVPFHPEQVMTIQEALHAHTMGSAHAAFEEDRLGSLTPGKFADLAVWSDNFYTVDPIDITNIKAVLTMINGKITYQAQT